MPKVTQLDRSRTQASLAKLLPERRQEEEGSSREKGIRTEKERHTGGDGTQTGARDRNMMRKRIMTMDTMNMKIRSRGIGPAVSRIS